MSIYKSLNCFISFLKQTECLSEQCHYDSNECEVQPDPWNLCTVKVDGIPCQRLFDDGVCNNACAIPECLLDGTDCLTPTEEECPDKYVGSCFVIEYNSFAVKVLTLYVFVLFIPLEIIVMHVTRTMAAMICVIIKNANMMVVIVKQTRLEYWYVLNLLFILLHVIFDFMWHKLSIKLYSFICKVLT